MIVIIFYSAVLLLNIAILFHLLFRKEYQNALNFFVAAMLMIRSYGQLLISISRTVDTAIVGNIFVYFGAVFLPPLLFLLAARACRIEIPTPVSFCMLLYSLVIVAMVTTAGRYPIYYEEVWLESHDGYATFEKVYGPGHDLYSILIVVYVLGFLGLAIYAIRNRKKISAHILVTMFSVAFLIAILYVIGRMVKFPIGLTSFVYLGASLIFLRITADVELHELSTCIFDSLNNKDNEAVIVFDKKNRFINANMMAKELFPEIGELYVGKKIDESDTVFYRDIVRSVIDKKKHGRKTPRIITVGNSRYEIQINDISFSDKADDSGTYVDMKDVSIREALKEMDERYGRELEEEVRLKEDEINNTLDKLISGLAELVSSRDSGTNGHISRVSAGVSIFVDRLSRMGYPGFFREYPEMVIKASEMHDLGKIAIDDEVLRAGENRTEEQLAIIRTHAEEGALIVKRVLSGVEDRKFVSVAVNVANFHHERYDGTGYPGHLKGEDIPLEARIVAFVDALDELIDEKKIDPEVAFDRIAEQTGTGFDPKLGGEFIKCRADIMNIYVKHE